MQPPTGVSRTHSPALAIPDDSPVGVTSTLQVTNPGRIKDLNVRIDAITHPFVGDLRIDVIGPDGTTVTLAEHPGGPDNGGRNLVGTVFSDQATTNISAASAPYTGTFRPQNDQLSRFDGKPRQGTWKLRVRDLAQGATGTLGGWGTQTQIAGCNFNGSDPPTVIGSGPPTTSSTRGAVFTFSSPNTQGARFECRLDGGDYQECSSPRSYSVLPDGSHSFNVRAIDATGNVDTVPPTYTWTVDAPPDTTIVSGPNGAVSSRQATFSFKADESASFTCQTDGQPAVACQSPVTLQGLSDGQHTFRVWAKDATNKQDATPAVRTWTVDTTPPETSITSAPGGLVNRGSAVIGFRSNEPGARFQCSLDNGAMTACSSPATFAGLGDGSHAVRVRAIDVAGNADPAPATASWVVDSTPPALSISSPSSGQALSDATPRVTGKAGTASGDAGTVLLRFYSGRLATGLAARTLVVPRGGTTGGWSATPSPLTDGTWTVRAEQTDAAGNTGTSAPVTFDVETTSPSFVIAPTEGYLADAAGRGISVLAGCASNCRISAKLSVAAAKARALGLPTKRGGSTRASFLLGSVSKRLGGRGAVTVALRPSRAARRALRTLRSLRARLAVKVAAAGAPVKLGQTVLLTRSAGMRRIARRGLRLRGACSELCAVEASLRLAPVDARRLRLKAPGAGPLTVASGRAGESRAPRLVLAVRRRYRAALRQAPRSAKATLEAAIRGRTGPPVALKSHLGLHP
jgi:subtilisin-like proprotein convertase family protein